jgi:hypothetical protein
MDLPQYLQGLSFRFVQPAHERSLAARAASAALARLHVPLDSLNTRLPSDHLDMRRKLRPTRLGSGGHPLAVRAILNRGVAHLEEREAFVAYGVGDGVSLLAAIAGNRDKLCIGIQDPDGLQREKPKQPGAAFQRRFDELSNHERHFVEESFKGCVTRLEDRPIGLCLVSANSHEPVGRRIAECEPHLAENAYLLIDNCNCAHTRQTAFEFVAASCNQYRVLLDAHTAEAGWLTLGRGLLVIQLLGRNTAAGPLSGRGTSSVLVPAA